MSHPQTTSSEDTVASSPLLEAEVASLDILFNRNPADLTRADRAAIVEALRAQRSKWKEEEAQGKTRASTPRKAAAPKKTLKDLLTDDSLFGDL